jgi:hypothetical protein
MPSPLPNCRNCRDGPRENAANYTTIAFNRFRIVLAANFGSSLLIGVDLPSLLAQKCRPRCQIAAIAAAGRLKNAANDTTIAFKLFCPQILAWRCRFASINLSFWARNAVSGVNLSQLPRRAAQRCCKSHDNRFRTILALYFCSALLFASIFPLFLAQECQIAAVAATDRYSCRDGPRRTAVNHTTIAFEPFRSPILARRCCFASIFRRRLDICPEMLLPPTTTASNRTTTSLKHSCGIVWLGAVVLRRRLKFQIILALAWLFWWRHAAPCFRRQPTAFFYLQ